MADELGIGEFGPEFVRIFSGKLPTQGNVKPWATPYAVSVFGQASFVSAPGLLLLSNSAMTFEAYRRA
jgi:hypothetical protein